MDESGIAIESRRSVKSEIEELEDFVAAVTKADLQMFVESAFYDSGSQCCTFKFKMGLQPGEEVADQLLAIARKTIRQFEWFGTVHHGRGEPDH